MFGGGLAAARERRLLGRVHRRPGCVECTPSPRPPSDLLPRSSARASHDNVHRVSSSGRRTALVHVHARRRTSAAASRLDDSLRARSAHRATPPAPAIAPPRAPSTTRLANPASVLQPPPRTHTARVRQRFVIEVRSDFVSPGRCPPPKRRARLASSASKSGPFYFVGGFAGCGGMKPNISSNKNERPQIRRPREAPHPREASAARAPSGHHEHALFVLEMRHRHDGRGRSTIVHRNAIHDSERRAARPWPPCRERRPKRRGAFELLPRPSARSFGGKKELVDAQRADADRWAARARSTSRFLEARRRFCPARRPPFAQMREEHVLAAARGISASRPIIRRSKAERPR